MTDSSNIHPLLTELSDYLDGTAREGDLARIRDHLESCRECRVILQHASDSARVDLPGIAEWSAQLDSGLVTALRSEAPEPKAGQLWRLRWDDTSVLSVVLRVKGEDVIVAPVGLDEWMADDYSIVVSPDWSPLGIAFAIWVGLEAVVPLVVLDVCFGEVDALDQIAAVRHAEHKGVLVEEAILVGSPIFTASDERSQYRRDLSLAMGRLSDATWLESSNNQGHELTPSLVELLEPVDPRRLAHVLKLDAPSTFALMSGERLLTPEEAALVGSLIDVDGVTILNAIPPVPPGLVHELSHPIHRQEIFRRAQSSGHSENEERRLALRELLPVAARRAGDEAAPLDWRRLVRDRFEA